MLTNPFNEDDNRYCICINKSGDELEDVNTYEEALDIIELIELSDIDDNMYRTGNYDIYDRVNLLWENIINNYNLC